MRDMRLLLINPNTTEAVTALVAERAREAAGEGVEIVAVTGRFGARYISSRAAAAVAGHAALDALAENVEGCDAVCLACFGDPGLLALKELSPVPVIGMAEASCHAAAGLGRRFAIVTGGALWGPMLTEFVASIGFASRLTGVHAVAPTGGEIARDPDGALDLLAGACREAVSGGAEAVILGGAALAGLAWRIADRVPAPLVCSTRAAVEAALAQARLGLPRSANPAAPVETLGLSSALARALG
jgi:allantoin racemase